MSRLARSSALAAWTTVTLALLITTSLGALRLTDPSAGRLIELTSLVPLGVVFALVAALVSTVLALLGRRRAGWLALLAIALGLVHAWWLSPLFLGAEPVATAGPRLMVMSQNLEYTDGSAVVDEVVRSGVDVLVVTDSSPATFADLMGAGIHDRLPFAVGLTEDGAAGTVLFSRFPLESDRPISDGGDSRIVSVQVPSLGAVDVVALHPTPPYQPGKWHADWQRILRAIDGEYGERITEHVVVAGDLNATLDHAPLRELGRHGFRDAAEQRNLGWVPTWPVGGRERRWGVPVPPMLPLDHVLTSPGLVVTKVDVRTLDGADHRAVVATVGPVGR